MQKEGTISRISGPFILAKDMTGSRMYELVRVGEAGVIGEIIRLQGTTASIQAYEDTTGIKPGEQIVGTGKPLAVELGPGLIGQIFDGLQRPLPIIEKLTGARIQRGTTHQAIDREREWTFQPTVAPGITVSSGDVIGRVQETKLVEHRILVPPTIKGGTIEGIVPEGRYTVSQPLAEVKTEFGRESLCMMQSWPIRQTRPYNMTSTTTTTTTEPLLTGQRIIDMFFPLAKGGTAMIPGGFGTGKTVLLQVLAQWIDVDIVIIVGCGERGNEMADLVERFSQLKDFRSGRLLMERTIIIANTSDMPIAAREAGVYTGASLAEYYRDMGKNVALMVDSTSRWAEALREISGRLEEMPGEEAYPAYLSSRLAEFYARAGHVKTLGSDERYGSIAIIGAVSPPGGDFSEPVTRSTLRLTRVFWALDFALAHRRHFPAINWMLSYSEYTPVLENFYKTIDSSWSQLRVEATSLLKEEEELREIVSLVGAEILGDKQRIIFEIAKLLKESFLLQSAYNPVDMYCPPTKTYQMLRLILKFYSRAKAALDFDVPIAKVLMLEVKEILERMKNIQSEEFEEASSTIDTKIDEQFDFVIKEAKGGGLE